MKTMICFFAFVGVCCYGISKDLGRQANAQVAMTDCATYAQNSKLNNLAPAR